MQGSLVNRLMEHSRYPKIELGMGGTVCMYSDRHPVTVIAIRYAKDGETVREIDTRGDNVGPNKRTWPAQEYDITPAPSLEPGAGRDAQLVDLAYGPEWPASQDLHQSGYRQALHAPARPGRRPFVGITGLLPGSQFLMGFTPKGESAPYPREPS